jgi:hypothetical protein
MIYMGIHLFLARYLPGKAPASVLSRYLSKYRFVPSHLLHIVLLKSLDLIC